MTPLRDVLVWKGITVGEEAGEVLLAGILTLLEGDATGGGLLMADELTCKALVLGRLLPWISFWSVDWVQVPG